MKKRRITGFLLTAVLLLILIGITGCGAKKIPADVGTEPEETVSGGETDKTQNGNGKTGNEERESTTEEEQTDSMAEEGQAGSTEESKNTQITYSVWNAYWNLEGAEKQIEAMSERIANINYFAAYFDKDDKVFIPEETTEFYNKTKESYKEKGWQLYLTVVNDQILADGSSALKSTDLLYRLFASETAYQTHAEELLSLALAEGYDGLEIDYENLRKDEKLWELFMPFVSYLYERCKEEGLQLRIVIETNIYADRIAWVEGPVYTVMCYNLYGSHSGPGPKADKAFLEEVMQKMQYVPGRVDYALANGGFDWCGDGTVKGITTAAAEALLESTQVAAERDSASGARYFSYTDEEGKSHEVWYADEETMETWMKWLSESGNKQFSIWRVGE